MEELIGAPPPPPSFWGVCIVGVEDLVIKKNAFRKVATKSNVNIIDKTKDKFITNSS